MCRIKRTFVQLPPREPWAPPMPGVMYEPATETEYSHICILIMHSDEDYLSFVTGSELAHRGFQVLCTNVFCKEGIIFSMPEKMHSVRAAVKYLRNRSDIKKIILMGHSGGATLLSAYQNVAENGIAVFQGPEKIMPFPDESEPYPAADGIMLLDSNWGNGAMQLFSLDPAVTDEGSGFGLDVRLNLFDPSNGFDSKGAHYSPAFIADYQKAQGERNNRLINAARERLRKIEKGDGLFSDDEIIVIPGAEQGFMNNKLYAQDPRLMCRSEKPHTLLHADGTTTEEIVRSIRGPENPTSMTHSLWKGARVLSVKAFLSSYAVRTMSNFGYDDCHLWGVDWSSSYSCTPGNVVGVHVPMLVMGMTAGWEFMAAETIYNMSTSADKTLAYVEGATHKFEPARHMESSPGQFGDTVKTLHDFVVSWIINPGRFLSK